MADGGSFSATPMADGDCKEISAELCPPYQEHALQFNCEGDQLLGLVCAPRVAEPEVKTAVLILVGGPQYRAGSHRQFTLLARFLAEQGFPSLRLDYRGMGDSEGVQRSFEHVSKDIAAAIDALLADTTSNIQQVAIWGLCDAAAAALLYCGHVKDARVRGLCLLNPWVRSDTTQAKTQIKHYYGQRLRQPEFWKKLLSGKVAVTALTEVLRTAKQAMSSSTKGAPTPLAPFQTRMARAWASFDGRIQVIISGRDLVAQEFLDNCKNAPEWRGLLNGEKVCTLTIAQADHTFSSHEYRQAVHVQTLEFIRKLNA